MKFEDLLPKPIEECTDAEIQEVVSKMNDKELQKFSTTVKKTSTKKTRGPTQKQKQKEDEFHKLLLKGK